MKRLILVAVTAIVAIVVIWHPPAAVSPSGALVRDAAPSRAPKRPRSTPSVDIVYVAGAVAHPGLYRVGLDARADDAIRLAGGLRGDADDAAVNLAAHVRDGDEIRVPVLGEPTTRARSGLLRARSSIRKRKTPRVLGLNDATGEQLAAIPGIGRAIAARIVEVRERDGAFTSLDQLLDVAGMTPARLDRASAFLRI